MISVKFSPKNCPILKRFLWPQREDIHWRSRTTQKQTSWSSYDSWQMAGFSTSTKITVKL